MVGLHDRKWVSILVVLEFGLWVISDLVNNVKNYVFQSLLFWNSVCEFCFCMGANKLLSFNPCCSGIRSVRKNRPPVWLIFFCFNPCCSGIRSVSPGFPIQVPCDTSFNPCCSGIRSVSGWNLMNRSTTRSFNPCCSGIRSVSSVGSTLPCWRWKFQSLLFWNSVCEVPGTFRLWTSNTVSILVVLEFGLWDSVPYRYFLNKSMFQSLLFWNSVCELPRLYPVESIQQRFNPCCSGIRSVRWTSYQGTCGRI